MKPTEKPLVKPKSENEVKVNVALGSKGKEKLNDERIIDDSKEGRIVKLKWMNTIEM